VCVCVHVCLCVCMHVCDECACVFNFPTLILLTCVCVVCIYVCVCMHVCM